MGRFQLSRRAVLRGAGSIAIALPWLEIMGDARDARAVVLRADDLPARVLEFGGCSVAVRENTAAGVGAKGGTAAAKGGTSP